MRTINARHEIITPIDGTEILKTIEAIGRTCYKSEDKITGDSCIGFVQRIIQRGHEAILEHFNISVRIFCDRGVSHEVVRHRVASYAQESTRYCDYSRDKFGSGVNYIDLAAGMKLDPKVSTLDAAQFNAIYEEWHNACLDAERHYLNMLALGATPQIARSVLNNSTKTEIVVTMNLREWRHFFRLRTASAAHPQMREVAIPLLKEFKEKIPVVFDDIPVPEGSKTLRGRPKIMTINNIIEILDLGKGDYSIPLSNGEILSVRSAKTETAWIIGGRQCGTYFEARNALVQTLYRKLIGADFTLHYSKTMDAPDAITADLLPDGHRVLNLANGKHIEVCSVPDGKHPGFDIRIDTQYFSRKDYADIYLARLIYEKLTGRRIITHAKREVPQICGINGAACRNKACTSALCYRCPIAEEHFAQMDGVELVYAVDWKELEI